MRARRVFNGMKLQEGLLQRLAIIVSVSCFCAAGQAQPQTTPLAADSNLPDSSIAAAEPTEALTHHSIRVLLDPINQKISVEDTITFGQAASAGQRQFQLNSNLDISNRPSGLVRLSNTTPAQAVGINSTGSLGAPTTQYSLRLSQQGAQQVALIYSGTIYDLAQQTSAEYAQSFSETSGIISPEGVYLNKGSVWIPDFGDDLITFDISVGFAPSARTWKAISQGDRNGDNGWRSLQPMEEVYLIAANFTEYSQQSDDVEVFAYLRTPDRNLATKYLQATERYLALYEPLLGDYPYSKFALIENFWETGYGMPSFTLLGEQVIRFPFILESSYPHEILHNWWGNGVYPDYESGNWSEGLTAYLADHLFREMDGAGSEYRKEMLARYKNYVASDDDFALSEFTSRNSAASQAVGYGKTLMLWHMLRVKIGDELFLSGLNKLYADYKFKRASFDDIAILFSEVSGQDLTPFFDQWVNRVGAPALTFSVEEINDNQARIMFAQFQAQELYTLTVPVALYYEGEEYPQVYDIALGKKVDGVIADNYAGLEAVLVDPYFDVFRQLDREETPPTIGELFGASEITFVLPSSNQAQWRAMAEAFAEGVNGTIVTAAELSELPATQSVWVLGKNNIFARELNTQLEPYGAGLEFDGINLGESVVPHANRSSVVVGRHPANPELAVGLIHVEDMVAMAGMIEKLPHYGKYSYLSFIGAEPTNDIKGVWSSDASPMRWTKPGSSAEIFWDKLPTVAPMAELPPRYLPSKLSSHVNELTTEVMAGRAIGTAGIDAAARYLADQFAVSALQPIQGSYYQQWTATREDGTPVRMRNVVGMIPGENPTFAQAPVVIGAHFDHLGINAASGEVYEGADDNASGVSIMLEVAARLSTTFAPQRPIVFVAFTGEEAGLLGSEQFVQSPPRPFTTEQIYAMVNLDGVGRLERRKLQVFATNSAYEWPFMAQGIGFTIGLQSEFPTQTIASSDHVPFLNAGIPAIHLFAGVTPDYHQTSDTADKLDYAGMSSIALWVEESLVYLADNTNPLRVTLGAEPVIVQPSPCSREASLGTVPDFGFEGPGVRISAATPGGAAAEAGMQAGDVLTSFNGVPIEDLQAYSNFIRAAAPGDMVVIDVLRDGQSLRAEVQLKAR